MAKLGNLIYRLKLESLEQSFRQVKKKKESIERLVT